MNQLRQPAVGRNVHRVTLALLGAVAIAAGTISPARAFDAVGYKARLDTTVEELKTKSLSDSAATLARLSDMMLIGEQAAKEYAAKQPKYAPLMTALVSAAPGMKGMTGNQLEDAWGEKGSAGDSTGVPLGSLGQWDEQRNRIELVTAPAVAYVLIKKWTTAQKAHWLDEAKDELTELQQHLAKLQ